MRGISRNNLSQSNTATASYRQSSTPDLIASGQSQAHQLRQMMMNKSARMSPGKQRSTNAL